MNIKHYTHLNLEFWNAFRRARTATLLDQRKTVLEILDKVRLGGDLALQELTQKIDGVNLETSYLRVPKELLESSAQAISEDIKQALEIAFRNIEHYQQSIKPRGDVRFEHKGAMLGQTLRPLKRVGVYVPGGSAPLVSTVLMTVIPAKIAGVEEIIVVSPPTYEGRIHPAILYACHLCGVEAVFQVGGAQAIAALAYGTESIPAVDKIVGPGNAYVALAKKEVYGTVDIDMVAGPSEIMVVAEEDTPLDWVVYDLMSQAEHDSMAASYLVCYSLEYAQKIKTRFEELMSTMPRVELIRSSWSCQAQAFVVESLEQALDVIDRVSPEHLELMIPNAEEVALQIRSAGAVFIGAYTPESIGDYVAGPSHVLPTNGTARFYSPLSVTSFMKATSIIAYSKERFRQEAKAVSALARLEGLEAHARAVDVRYGEK